MPGVPPAGSQLRRILRPYRSWLVLAFVCVLLAAGAGLAVPWLSGELVDTALNPEAGSPSLDQLALLLLVLFAIQAVAGGVRSWALSRAGQGAVRDLRMRMFERVLRLPVAYFDRTHSGVITSRLLSDAGAIYGSGAGTGPQAAYAAITVVVGTVLLIWISPALGALILCVVPVAAGLAWLSGRQTRELSRAYQDQLADTSAFAADVVSGVRMVKNHRAEPQVLARFSDHVDRSVALGMARTRVRSVWSSVSVFLASTAIVAAVWLGGRQIQAGQLTAGELVAFIWYGLVVTRGIAELSGQYGRIQQMLGSADRVVTLLDETPEEMAATPSHERPTRTCGADLVLPDPAAAVELCGVTMTYPGRSSPAVTDLSFVVHPGESVAVVGPSGAGKSTIGRLLLRHYEPDAGSVRVGGVDVRSVSVEDLRRSIAVIPQDAHLLSDTVAANLRLARPNASDADLVDALRSANAWDFVAALPHGLDTLIGERATTLSGGQQQRLAIARALLLNAPVLVLDEATSALDAHSEALVQAALLETMATRSTVVIAHRLTTIRHCDRVVVMSAGRIVEQGTPDELFAAAGGFAEMVRLQG